MNKRDLVTLIQFNFWANRRLLAACEPLPLDAFTRAISPDPGWGNLRGILVHALDTEYGWRAVLQRLDDDILDASDFPDVPTLQARWEVERAAWLEYVSGLSDENLHQSYDPPMAPQVWQTILHVIVHSVQHRSEAAAILTGYGHSPGELDFDVFLKEHPDDH